MKLYTVKEYYIEKLHMIDNKVDYNKDENRPYIGIVFSINNIEYYAPLTSPKSKHRKMKNNLDFIKLKSGEYGAINLNNMIPVINSALNLIDINNINNYPYRRLLQNQLKCINKISDVIYNKATKLYKIVTSNNDILKPNELLIKQRCCDFKLLEHHYKEFST